MDTLGMVVETIQHRDKLLIDAIKNLEQSKPRNYVEAAGFICVMIREIFFADNQLSDYTNSVNRMNEVRAFYDKYDAMLDRNSRPIANKRESIDDAVQFLTSFLSASRQELEMVQASRGEPEGVRSRLIEMTEFNTNSTWNAIHRLTRLVESHLI